MSQKVLFTISALIIAFSVNLYSQQCKVITNNIHFESDNSLTFDVVLKNTGTSSWIFSNAAFVWTLNTDFLNGGTPTFSLVPGYSEFPTGAYPPSTLITQPNMLRTSSNMPGSNGIILPDQSLRLYRFRLQTSAASFNSEYLSAAWKTAVTPYTRLYSWNEVSGVPVEIPNPAFSIQQLILDENFDYGNVSDPDLLNVTTNWIRHSGTAGPAYLNTSLSYTSYLSSGIGGSVSFTHGSSGTNDGDVHRVLPTIISTDENVYTAFLLNLSSAQATNDYFFHLGPEPLNSIYKARVFARVNGSGWSFGLSKSTETAVLDNTILNFNQTYLVVVKYVFSTATTSDDLATLYVYDTGIPPSEPGSPLLTIGPVGAGVTGDPDNIGAVAIRQGTNSPTGVIDGIRVGTTWNDIFPAVGSPLITVNPSTLSGFSYLVGGGPSASQSYNLSGSNLTPASGTIAVTGTTHYEISLNNSIFGTNLNVSYSGGNLSATPVYVRLKAGLPGGVYEGELITNAGGGASTQNVTCSGAVIKPEPTNHVTNFAGVLGNPNYYYNNFSWTDAIGAVLPDGYLIKRSTSGFASIVNPVDGVPEANSFSVQNIDQGIQAAVFTGFADSTYYYKIFPFTNSGSFIDYKTNGSVPQFMLTDASAPSFPIDENFQYATGSLLTNNGWVAHSSGGINPITVNASPLTYTGYINSGIGKSVTLNTSGEDDNRAFHSVTSGKVYASFMVNVTSAQANGDYFFHFGPENTTSLYYGRVYVKLASNNNLAFGLSKSSTSVSTPAVYTDSIYTLGTTYLIVVSYGFSESADDTVKLWVNPTLTGNEPPPNLTHAQAVSDAASLGMFALRQGSASNAASLILGGIRVNNTWLTGSTNTFQLSVSIANGWNMVSVPGINPAGQGVNNWWINHTGTVYKFVPGSGYNGITTTTPGEGYWMKNNSAEVYNTGDEWPAGGIQIVTHNPISVALGWNMFGGYEDIVNTTALTTTPPGQIVFPIYKFVSGTGYQTATQIVPGYGYWVKVSSACQINVPDVFAKGNQKQEEFFRNDWGRIILTDAVGDSYTLYAVKGNSKSGTGVDLSNYELPPLPPEGLFDVRFGSGRVAEDLSSDFQSIEMRGVTYPVKVKVENMDIKLMDLTGRMINTNIKSGEEFTIDNSGINKIMVAEQLIPDKYALEQNYPNPFNPTTTIEFSLPENVKSVKLSIYNILGEKIAELVNGSMQAGKYQYQWNAKDFASGTYIYELRTEKFVSIKKMIYLK